MKGVPRIRKLPARVMPMSFYNGTPCIPWPGSLNRGYGSVVVAGKRKNAHRAVYENFNGEVAADLVIDHLCRNHACVNPDHLEAVTQRENLLRGVGASAVNATKTHCVNGHPLSGENLRMKPGKGGLFRACILCSRLQRRARRAKAKQTRLTAALKEKK